VHALALHIDLGTIRGMEREKALDTFTGHHATNGESGRNSRMFFRDDNPRKHLNMLLISLTNLNMNLHIIADLKMVTISDELFCNNISNN
jgi:hypothetical protein